MKLQRLQEQILNQIRLHNHPVEPGAQYLNQIAHSKEIYMIKSIRFYWRRQQLSAVLTLCFPVWEVTLDLDTYILRFLEEVNFSLNRIAMSRQFLAFMQNLVSDCQLLKVMHFQSAILSWKVGEPVDYRMLWESDPFETIARMIQGTDNLSMHHQPCWVEINSEDTEQPFRITQLEPFTS